jgi:hypothetical protein
VVRALAVRWGAGPLRPLWALAHELALRAVALVLTRGSGDASAYARGSLGAGRAEFGHSDLDMAIVVDGDAAVVRSRWRALAARFASAARAIDMAVYNAAGLRLVAGAPTLAAAGARHHGPAAPADEGDLLVRPGLGPPLRGWRLITGAERRPTPAAPGAQRRRLAAWLELQSVWRVAFDACRFPLEPHIPQVCVKLVADPARIWLWLAEGRLIDDRREALEAALRSLPGQEAVLRQALASHAALARGGPADLGRALEGLLAMSAVLERRVGQELEQSGTTAVELDGDATELALGPGGAGALEALGGSTSRPVALCDWRARAWPLPPDEALAPVALDPGDPGALARAIEAAGGFGPYAALRHGGLLVVPGPGVLRAVQCSATDPVSFALLAGDGAARFPESEGWSARDCARRAVEEHAAWLSGDGETSARRTLGMLLSAARAALFLESVEEGEPRLAVTVSAAARALDARGAGGMRDCAARYREARSTRSEPPAAAVALARETVLALPAYGGAITRAEAARP